MDEYFVEAGPERCGAYAERLIRAVAMAPSESWKRRLVEELPGAAQFHSFRIEGYRRRSIVFRMPEDTLLQGIDIQINELEARVSRAARHERSPEVRAQTETQIKALFESAKQALKGRLQGAVAASYIDRDLNQMSEAWTGALDKVYHTLMDSPLDPRDFDKVISAVQARAQEFSPLVLTVEELRDQSRLKELGVPGLLEDIHGVLMQAPKLCFNDYDPELIRQRTSWEAKLEAQYAAFIKAKNAAARAEAEAGAVPRVAKSTPSAPPPPPKEDVKATPETAPPRRDQGAPLPAADESSSGFALLLIVGGAGIVVVTLWWNKSKTRLARR